MPIARASNPLGFYALAASYAALAGVCAYGLWLLLATPRAGRPRAAPATETDQTMNLAGRVVVTPDGRCGQVTVQLGGRTHNFYWEYGGGDCIAIVHVPDAAQWPTITVLASYPRLEFLHALALEVGKQQCPGAGYHLGERAIEFYPMEAPPARSVRKRCAYSDW